MSAPHELFIGFMGERPWYRASANPPKKTYGKDGTVIRYLSADLVTALVEAGTLLSGRIACGCGHSGPCDACAEADDAWDRALAALKEGK